jgi:glycosyltransferase involved in cell wall biosynthesis
MRILHAVPTYWPATRYGGPIRSVHALGRALVRAGHQVDVVTTSVDGDTDSAVAHDVAVDCDGVHVWYARSRVLRRLYWSPMLGRRADALMPEADLAHVHSVFLWPTWRVARAARAQRRPYVVSPRGMLVPELIDARSRWVKRAWIAGIERTNLRHAAAIHVTSERERDDLLRLDLGPLPPIRVVPNGVDIPVAPMSKTRGTAFAFVGRLSRKKRLDLILRALAGVNAATLDVLGPDAENLSSELERQCGELGITGRVRFHGEVDAARRDAVLSSAAALILPSVQENFGNVVAEALACGCPAIVTDGVGAAVDVQRAQAGWLVAPDADALAQVMQRVLADPAAAAAAGERGRIYVAREWSWSGVAARMCEIYAEALAVGRRA